MTSRMFAVLACALLAAAAPVAAQPKGDCSAGRGYACNPRKECLAQAETKLKGGALDAAKKDCSRMPTSGTCYGADLAADCPDGGKKSSKKSTK